MALVSSGKRANAMLVIMVMMVTVLAGRAVQIGGLDANANAQAAAAQLTRTQSLEAERGEITDRNGQALALTQPAFKVIADPTAISTNGREAATLTDEQKAVAAQAPQAIAETLVKYLGGQVSDYLPKLTNVTREDGQPNRYEVLKRKVSAARYEELTADLDQNGWYGIYSETDPVRYYPNGDLASNVIGYVNGEGDGIGGLEYSMDAQLNGVDGKATYQTAPYGTIPLGNTTLVPAVNGTTYRTTIDSELQWMAQQELNKAIADAQAKRGVAIVMSVQTGEILAMANGPTFDSNDFGKANQDDLGNRAITDAYEPGSVQKVLTTAALLDKSLITPDTAVEVPSQIRSGDGYIRDANAHGTIHLTARGVLANSSNIGTVQLTRQMDKPTLAKYLRDFGLGSASGVELPGEPAALGEVPGPDMPDYTRDQISFGQGLSTSALQMSAAIASVTNGGIYHQPTVLQAGWDSQGNAVKIERQEPRRVISEQASKDLIGMMEAGVASDGIAGYQSRMIPGYRMAGKSGTAQKIGKYGNYDGGYTGTYVAVAPVENPQILVYVAIDEPQNNYYGGVVAMPPARNLMQMALPRYGILPSANIPPYTAPLTYQP